MTRIVVLGCEAPLRARLEQELGRLGAEVVFAQGGEDAVRVLGEARVDAVVAALDPAPRTSGLGLLLCARQRHPGARRVLVVDRRGPLVDAAVAIGIVDRVLSGPPSATRLGALAEWLTDVASHAPRRAATA